MTDAATVTLGDIRRCPRRSLSVEHYRADGSCGCYGVRQRESDDCLNACVATLLAVDATALPRPDFAAGDWFDEWATRVRDATAFELHSLALPRPPAGRWIANLHPRFAASWGHAVVMRGGLVEWDPNRARPRANVEWREVQTCIVAVPLDPRP